MSIADSTNYVWVGHKKQRKTTACVFTPSCTVRVYADSTDNEGHTQVAVQLEPIERTDDDGHILQNMVVDLGAPDSDRARRPDTNAMSARVRIVKLSAEETEPGKLRDHAMARMPLSLLKELTEALPNESCFPQSRLVRALEGHIKYGLTKEEREFLAGVVVLLYASQGIIMQGWRDFAKGGY